MVWWIWAIIILGLMTISFIAGAVFHYWIVYPLLHDDEHIMTFSKGADNGTLGPED